MRNKERTQPIKPWWSPEKKGCASRVSLGLVSIATIMADWGDIAPILAHNNKLAAVGVLLLTYLGTEIFIGEQKPKIVSQQKWPQEDQNPDWFKE